MFTINESIEELKKEIEEKKEQITLLENWNSLEFTEENYHKLCETDFRGSKELGEKFEEIFPFLNLISQKSYPNNYTFLMKINGKDYKVLIPNTSSKNISIIIPIPFKLYTEDDLQRINEKIEKINNKLNAKTIFERANYVAGHYKKPFRVLAYLTQYGNKKNYIARLMTIKEDLEKQKKSYINKIEEIKKEQKEYDETIKTFNEKFVPKFLEWTNEVVIKEMENNYFAINKRIKKEN